jgi:hypothetical protein
MKKDRNTFFNESAYQTSYGVSMPNYQMQGVMPANGYGSQASQSFYSGPMPINSQMGINQGNNYNDYSSELESRLSKIERQINRIDARVSKLESKGIITSENFDTTNNMYML